MTVAGVEYHFHGWFFAPLTPSGAAQLVNVDAAAALGITVTQAAATTGGAWYEVEFDFEAADASTTIDLGSGSVTSGEEGYWSAVQLYKNYVDADASLEIHAKLETLSAPTAAMNVAISLEVQ